MPRPDLPPGARRVFQEGETFYVVGERRHPLRDAYHVFLRARWPVSIAMIGAGYVAANLVFAALYYVVGGVEGTDGSFFDALSFSVQTMGTIGYGVMHPVSRGATVIMETESMFGIVVTALATGLVFAKFSRPTAFVEFSRHAVITPRDGKPTLIFRVGNRRGNIIIEAQLHVIARLTTRTLEGELFYQGHDLKLVRDRQVGMTRGWTVMHVIDDTSPLHGLDAEALKTRELEILIALTGLDDTTMQTVFASHRYVDDDLRFGHRLADTVRMLPNGEFVVDLHKFHAIVPDRAPRDSVRGAS